jgi:MFS family permease
LNAVAEAPGLIDVLRFMAGQRALLHLMAAAAVITVVISGPGAFAYSFFIRYHHMKLQVLGPLLGGLSAIIGLIVIPGSGLLSDRLGKRDPRLRLFATAGVLLLATPTVLVSYLAPQPFALPLFLATLLIQGAWLGPLYGTAQNLSPSRMRSRVSSILFVVNGLIGVGLGPVVVGALSDVLSRSLGVGGLRAALMICTSLGFWAALHFYLATRTLERDLDRAAAVTS